MGIKKTSVAVGMSGGVDSSVTAAILLDMGFDVVGVAMKKYDGSIPVRDSQKSSCYGPGEERSISSASSVCKILGIPLYVIDIRKEFQECVLDYFRISYLGGKTPNPCIECNHRIKFGSMIEKAHTEGIDFEYFATGHYARIEESKGRFFLKRGMDLKKDQSYFLYMLTPDQLSRTFFPLGEYSKQKVRDLAKAHGLKTGERAESQDFVADNDYSSLFKDDEFMVGDIVDEQGNHLGRHRGIIHYTIGQRRGLRISSSSPLYVKNLDSINNRVVVGKKEELYSRALVAGNINLISIDRLDQEYRIKAKIRYRHKEANAILRPYGDDKAKVVFDDPQLSITPGQSVVFYVGNYVLGGGIIEESMSI